MSLTCTESSLMAPGARRSNPNSSQARPIQLARPRGCKNARKRAWSPGCRVLLAFWTVFGTQVCRRKAAARRAAAPAAPELWCWLSMPHLQLPWDPSIAKLLRSSCRPPLGIRTCNIAMAISQRTQWQTHLNIAVELELELNARTLRFSGDQYFELTTFIQSSVDTAMLKVRASRPEWY